MKMNKSTISGTFLLEKSMGVLVLENLDIQTMHGEYGRLRGSGGDRKIDCGSGREASHTIHMYMSVCCCKELFMIHQPSVNGPTIPQWGWSWLIRMLDGITAMGLQKHYHDLQEGNAATEMQGNALLT
ncbi:hypothetical protein C5167_006053 [Papaver somniferum]|uniref:Uncharacterized protein n=1 Tax=Papaver somniferum TaxID=3469 RepID=A0A4Y7JFG5_PAPSO|nr:hypothetical protein C5167_006053 [Papaver somniferum]